MAIRGGRQGGIETTDRCYMIRKNGGMAMSYKKSSLIFLMVVTSLAVSSAGATEKGCNLPGPASQGGVISLDGTCTYTGTIKM